MMQSINSPMDTTVRITPSGAKSKAESKYGGVKPTLGAKNFSERGYKKPTK